MKGGGGGGPGGNKGGGGGGGSGVGTGRTGYPPKKGTTFVGLPTGGGEGASAIPAGKLRGFRVVERQRQYDSGECFNCHQTGHKAIDCPRPKKNAGGKDVKVVKG